MLHQNLNCATGSCEHVRFSYENRQNRRFPIANVEIACKHETSGQTGGPIFYSGVDIERRWSAERQAFLLMRMLFLSRLDVFLGIGFGAHGSVFKGATTLYKKVRLLTSPL